MMRFAEELQNGRRLKACVVPGEPAAADLDPMLRRRLRALLTPEDRPASYAFGPVLPCGDMHKPADW